MADFTSSQTTAGFASDSMQEYAAGTAPKTLTTLTNIAGAAVSLALVAGIGVWGYNLVIRDVTGIPVVRAVQGEMRVRPEEPGGELARHQGLSVNVVAAEGSAGRPADQLRLAPKPVELEAEDQPVQVAMVAAKSQEAEAPLIDASEAIRSGNVQDLVAQLTDGVAPLSGAGTEAKAAADPVDAAVAMAMADTSVKPKVVKAVLNAPGVRNSLRPRNRPAGGAVVTQAALQTAPVKASASEVDPATLPAGTRMAQLGAFDSPEVAREQWDRLQGQFGPYLQGKDRVVQKATSGGRVFYRLRALGFEDIADARRFCSALVAENADCIPVVMR
ncbi:SPOR domain-containing protein [Sulfitobacter delicatus]|uniref:Sporulation related domain-containing protein n=1 Tax=Sulfitobacter delicatus TaxID=218672 RepID=A0A1G7QHR4_9RHOB|nr:SPOR domain-containing protein [Sulfitobacter delicatus]SDF98107.1 Sporulation related domain-containing protein [Sulfitobacter delicatus]